MCFRISDMSLCKIEKKHTYTLNEVSIHHFNLENYSYLF
jgi:hypothetical protein